MSDRAEIYRYALEEITAVGAYNAENCEGMADYAQRVLDGAEDERITRELGQRAEEVQAVASAAGALLEDMRTSGMELDPDQDEDEV